MHDPIAFFNDNAYNNNFCLFRSVHEEKIEDTKGVIGHRISMKGIFLNYLINLLEKVTSVMYVLPKQVSSVSILC